jgi:hypothetical protein
MDYGSVYYSEVLDRIVIVTTGISNDMVVKGISKSNQTFQVSSFDKDKVSDELLKKDYELIGYL